jgi:hypothetical protein
MLTKTEEISRKGAKRQRKEDQKIFRKLNDLSRMALQRNGMKMLLKDPRENV